jgi:hypothetical protein
MFLSVGGGRSRISSSGTTRRPAIDISNFGGGRCRKSRQHPPRALPSTSSTWVVVASTPMGAHHRRFQLRWWPLPDLPLRPPQGARHRRLQLWWWPLPNLPAAPPSGPAIDVSNFSGGCCRTYRQHPRGAAIDVSNFGGGRCQILPPAPPGGPPSTSSTLVVAGVGPCRQHPLGGPSLTSSTSVVSATGPCRQHPQGARH